MNVGPTLGQDPSSLPDHICKRHIKNNSPTDIGVVMSFGELFNMGAECRRLRTLVPVGTELAAPSTVPLLLGFRSLVPQDPRSLRLAVGLPTQHLRSGAGSPPPAPQGNRRLYFYSIPAVLWFLEMAFKICFLIFISKRMLKSMDLAPGKTCMKKRGIGFGWRSAASGLAFWSLKRSLTVPQGVRPLAFALKAQAQRF